MLGVVEGKSSLTQWNATFIYLLAYIFRIIAVNYPARAQGVTRHMRGDEAKENCPDIELVKVPNIREKADLSKYRNAGKQVAAVLQTFTPLLTKASIDEAYLDLTEQVQSRLLDMNKVKCDWISISEQKDWNFDDF